MKYLFVHQNFPAQYVHLAGHLAAQPENQVWFLTQRQDGDLPGVHKHLYTVQGARGTVHPYVQSYESAVRTALGVLDGCKVLKEGGMQPDIILGHAGWGETLLLKNVFPETPVMAYLEYYYTATGADVGFDPEFTPARDGDGPRLQFLNSVQDLGYAHCDLGHTATNWQRSRFPQHMQERIRVLHEGIDTGEVCPKADAWLALGRDDLRLTRADEVITFVSRNLEPYRGFHAFMRALPEVLRRRPAAHVLIVGGDDVSYGQLPPYGGTYRQMMLAELRGKIDTSRVHFIGQVPWDVYLNVLQVSSLHVYFTYPFVLSWSLIEALSTGCLVLGSDNAPVTEVIRDGENGHLVDMFDTAAVADRMTELLATRAQRQPERDAARSTAVERYDFRSRALEQWLTALNTLKSN